MRRDETDMILHRKANTHVRVVEQLRRIMEDKEVTFAHTLRTAGYSPAILHRLFTGRSSTRITTFEDIANTMGYTLKLVPIPKDADVK